MLNPMPDEISYIYKGTDSGEAVILRKFSKHIKILL
jgi:hypothetical protein